MNQTISGISLLRSVRIQHQTVTVDGKKVYTTTLDKTDQWCAECYKHLELSYPKFYKMDTMSKLGILASEFLLQGFDVSELDEFKRCLVLQNTESSLATDRNYAETLKTIPSPALFVYTLPNIVMGEMAIKYKFKGENTFFVSPLFNAKQLMEYSHILFQDNIAELAIVGFIDHTSSDQDVLLCLLGKSKQAQPMLDIQQIEAIYNA